VPDLPTFEDLFEIEKREALLRNPRLSRAALDRKGSEGNILLAGAAAGGDEVVNQVVQVGAAAFLDSAVGADLDRLVFDRYGLTRKSAAPAIGSVQFTTTTPAGAAFNIPVGTTLATSDGKQYETTDAQVFPALSVGPITCAIRSVQAGAAQQAIAGSITNLVSALTGAPSDLKVTNVLATAGADDDETDNALRDRARNFFPSVRRGTLRAIEQGALAVAGVRTAKAFEVLDALGRPARFVQLVITDAFTDSLVQLDTNPPLYQTQSQTLSQAVFDALDDVRAGGIFVQVTVAQVILITVQLALTFDADADVNDAAIQARAAIVNYTNNLSAGSVWSYAAAVAVLRQVDGLSSFESVITSPIGDLNPKALQAIRTTAALVTASSLQPNRPLANSTNPDAFIPSP